MRNSHIFLAIATCLMLAACGSTYIDESLIESSTTVAETVEVTEVPDPYYGDGDGFDRVLTLVESACQGLLADIQNR